jgi:hypothetical protein
MVIVVIGQVEGANFMEKSEIDAIKNKTLRKIMHGLRITSGPLQWLASFGIIFSLYTFYDESQKNQEERDRNEKARQDRIADEVFRANATLGTNAEKQTAINTLIRYKQTISYLDIKETPSVFTNQTNPNATPDLVSVNCIQTQNSAWRFRDSGLKQEDRLSTRNRVVNSYLLDNTYTFFRKSDVEVSNNVMHGSKINLGFVDTAIAISGNDLTQSTIEFYAKGDPHWHGDIDRVILSDAYPYDTMNEKRTPPPPGHGSLYFQHNRIDSMEFKFTDIPFELGFKLTAYIMENNCVSNPNARPWFRIGGADLTSTPHFKEKYPDAHLKFCRANKYPNGPKDPTCPVFLDLNTDFPLINNHVVFPNE